LILMKPSSKKYGRKPWSSQKSLPFCLPNPTMGAVWFSYEIRLPFLEQRSFPKMVPYNIW
jgi:hypothetical protein